MSLDVLGNSVDEDYKFLAGRLSSLSRPLVLLVSDSEHKELRKSQMMTLEPESPVEIKTPNAEEYVSVSPSSSSSSCHTAAQHGRSESSSSMGSRKFGRELLTSVTLLPLLIIHSFPGYLQCRRVVIG
jgi:hypothetical protein